MAGTAIQSNSIYVVNSTDVRVENLAKNGAENVTVRYLVDERQGSNKFSLRLYAVGKGGCTPLDKHDYEHQVYVLRGKGALRTGDGSQTLRRLREGDSIFIPSNAVHQFINEQDDPLTFLCVKGNPSIYKSETLKEIPDPDDTKQNFC